ncbi:hypothetical protein [Roseinatronobacter sp. NSM]|uniref:hypothetical protein n=1 Tax=Roseinatronobacter sp. NSM TaxID=3457785 RepID=UPI0040372FD6
MASPQDKRNRLVGPPPSFEVNVIQHLRESLAEPANVAIEEDNAQAEPSQAKVPHDGYHILSQLTPNAVDDTTAHVDVTL